MTRKATRLIAPNGTVVEVDADKAERLISQGFAMPQGFRKADERKAEAVNKGNGPKPTTTPPRRAPARVED